MQMKNSSLQSESINLLLREAKRLHRAAKAESLQCALPVLRRLIASNTLKNISLVALHRKREIIQRKHILNMLAYEVGYNNWAEYKQEMIAGRTITTEHYSILLKNTGYPNQWFSNLKEAKEYARINGGKPIPVGNQAVVIVGESA